MKTGYLRKYFPPFPCLPIRMGYPSEGFRLGPIEALIDTGADGSLVPQSLLDELGAPLVDQVRVRSQWGETHSANLYTVDLGIRVD
jgi:predicted aspartyl protease